MLGKYIPPAVYGVKKDEKGEYYLDLISERFKTPERIYGTLDDRAKYFWQRFKDSDASLGVLLTGIKGAGKSELSKLLSNYAIDNGLPVILLTDIEADTELIYYLNTFVNVVLFFDEFGKVFPYHIQNKMLTMFSDTIGHKRLFILTENEQRVVSEFILNRPGRVKYHLDFQRLEKQVIEEYCLEHNVDEKFYNDLMEKYRAAPTFSFDHLQAIISEYEYNRTKSFEEVLSILNLSILKKPKMLVVESVKDIVADEDVAISNHPTIKKSEFLEDHTLFISLSNGPGLRVSLDNAVEVTDDRITLVASSRYRIVLADESKAEIKIVKNESAQPMVQSQTFEPRMFV